MDSRVFVFSYFTNQQSWGFIALNNSRIAGQIQIVPIEKWNDEYTICRVLYSQLKARELIESDQMMVGPDLYTVLDVSTSSESSESSPVITIWKPRNIEGIEFIHGDDTSLIAECFTFEKIKQKCIQLLGITLTKTIDMPDGEPVKEFALPI
jgi:hypothetical protein